MPAQWYPVTRWLQNNPMPMLFFLSVLKFHHPNFRNPAILTLPHSWQGQCTASQSVHCKTRLCSQLFFCFPAQSSSRFSELQVCFYGTFFIHFLRSVYIHSIVEKNQDLDGRQHALYCHPTNFAAQSLCLGRMSPGTQFRWDSDCVPKPEDSYLASWIVACWPFPGDHHQHHHNHSARCWAFIDGYMIYIMNKSPKSKDVGIISMNKWISSHTNQSVTCGVIQSYNSEKTPTDPWNRLHIPQNTNMKGFPS